MWSVTFISHFGRTLFSENYLYIRNLIINSSKNSPPPTRHCVWMIQKRRNSTKWESYAVDLWRNYIYSIVEACTFNFHLHDDCCWWWWYFSSPLRLGVLLVELNFMMLLCSAPIWLSFRVALIIHNMAGRAVRADFIHFQQSESWGRRNVMLVHLYPCLESEWCRHQSQGSGEREKKKIVPMINVPAWGRANRFSLFFSSQSCFSAYHLALMAGRIVTAYISMFSHILEICVCGRYEGAVRRLFIGL